MQPFPIAVLLTFATVVASPARAADPPKKELTLVQGKGGAPILTKEQLRTCMTRAAALKQRDAELETDAAGLAQVKADLAGSGEQLAAQLEHLDRTSAEAVAAYNTASATRDQQIDAYETRAAAFNARVDARDAERSAYGPACVNRRYLEVDEKALGKGK